MIVLCVVLSNPGLLATLNGPNRKNREFLNVIGFGDDGISAQLKGFLPQGDTRISGEQNYGRPIMVRLFLYALKQLNAVHRGHLVSAITRSNCSPCRQ